MDFFNKLNYFVIKRQSLLICFTLVIGLFLYSPVNGQPSNDDCSNATVITSIPFTDNVNTENATPDGPSLSCNGNGNQTDGNSVWYVWTPEDDVTVQISSFGSDYDVALGVFTGECGSLEEVACLDYGGADAFMFDAEADVTYYIKVGEYLDGAGGGNLVFRVGELEPIILESVANGTSAPISGLLAKRAVTTSKSSTVKEVPMFKLPKDKVNALGKTGVMMDPLLEKSNLQKSSTPADNNQVSKNGSGPKLLQIFDGAENDDNDNLLGFLLYPPDTDGDVGPNYYVQMINDVTTVFDKTGAVVLGPFPNNVFWTGLGGLCEYTNNGDVMVLYDEETDRWLVAQFALLSPGLPPWSLCVACSKTNDPTGEYYQHEFSFDGIGFPDYPKYGFVSDAIGVMVNLFSPFQGSGLGAIDKSEAFSDGPATMVFFRPGTNEFGFLPGDNDGPVFDDVPPTFATNNAGFFANDRIDFWEIHPDFANPGNSTASEVARIPVTPFNSFVPGITQPDGAPLLDPITDRLMHRLQLRNFGNEKMAVVNHTVNADGNGKAGIRWYEFRNHKDKGWKLFQENTFSPDGDNRWMGSIAKNEKNETLLGYSISSTTTYPSIGVAGRLGESSLMNAGELLVYDGNVDQYVQLGNAGRWGDYSAMAVDPVDGTFWYTQEYTKPNTRLGELAGWATKIAQVKVSAGKLAKPIASENSTVNSYALLQNYPNPFNPETVIGFQIPEANHVTIKIFNSIGQEVRTLLDMQYEEGIHSVIWDGKDNMGKSLSSGVYFYRLQAGTYNQVKKMSLLR